MREKTLAEIKKKALEFSKKGLVWHFHILTPTCSFNTSSKYAFILECPSQDFSVVNYSERAEKELGKELSPLIHGKKILENKKGSVDRYIPSAKVGEMTKRAIEMNQENIEWHHHLLYPDCQFNNSKQLWSLIVEDSRSGVLLESKTKEEPLNDLKQIEMAFYAK